jgi:uncharacterized protein YukJ
MPVRNYGVLKGRVLERRQERQHGTPHFQLLLDAGGTRFRVAVGTRSYRGAPDLLYHARQGFQHPQLAALAALADGFHPLLPGDPRALDYVSQRLVRRSEMVALPASLPGPDNDLNEKLERWAAAALSDRGMRVLAFGSRWGPEPGRRDDVFGFLPGNGVHDIHLNQGNPQGRHEHDNGSGQDGALLFHDPSDGSWTAVFLAFQSQRWE